MTLEELIGELLVSGRRIGYVYPNGGEGYFVHSKELHSPIRMEAEDGFLYAEEYPDVKCVTCPSL